MRRNASSPAARIRAQGMTLVEVLVALAVVAVSLLAASRAFSQWIYGSQFLHERMLASVCAQNTLTQWQISRELPPVGTLAKSCEQDGRVFQVQTEISTTRNPMFRRAQLRVLGPSSDAVLVTITTAIAKP